MFFLPKHKSYQCLRICGDARRPCPLVLWSQATQAWRLNTVRRVEGARERGTHRRPLPVKRHVVTWDIGDIVGGSRTSPRLYCRLSLKKSGLILVTIRIKFKEKTGCLEPPLCLYIHICYVKWKSTIHRESSLLCFPSSFLSDGKRCLHQRLCQAGGGVWRRDAYLIKSV